jgi:hypothetical protein
MEHSALPLESGEYLIYERHSSVGKFLEERRHCKTNGQPLSTGTPYRSLDQTPNQPRARISDWRVCPRPRMVWTRRAKESGKGGVRLFAGGLRAEAANQCENAGEVGAGTGQAKSAGGGAGAVGAELSRYAGAAGEGGGGVNRADEATYIVQAAGGCGAKCSIRKIW